MSKSGLSRSATSPAIVVGVATAGHRGRDAGLAQASREGKAGVLRALVGVVDYWELWSAPTYGHVERIKYEPGVECFRHRPADHAAREDVGDAGQIEEAVQSRDVLDVADPGAQAPVLAPKADQLLPLLGLPRAGCFNRAQPSHLSPTTFPRL